MPYRELLYNDDVYNAILKLKEMHKQKADERKEMLEIHLKAIDNIIERYGYMDYVVLEGI